MLSHQMHVLNGRGSEQFLVESTGGWWCRSQCPNVFNIVGGSFNVESNAIWMEIEVIIGIGIRGISDRACCSSSRSSRCCCSSYSSYCPYYFSSCLSRSGAHRRCPRQSLARRTSGCATAHQGIILHFIIHPISGERRCGGGGCGDGI